LKDPIVPAVGYNEDRQHFPLEAALQIAERAGAAVACSGPFHDTATGGPVGPLVSHATVLRQEYHGRRAGRLVRIDASGLHLGEARMVTRPMGDGEVAFWAGPTLLEDGGVVAAPAAEGYRDQGLLGSAKRVALGADGAGRLLAMATHGAVTLRWLAGMMRDAGSETAINLDGGSSSFLCVAGASQAEILAGARSQLPFIIAFRPRLA
jgi:hypothetical protein